MTEVENQKLLSFFGVFWWFFVLYHRNAYQEGRLFTYSRKQKEIKTKANRNLQLKSACPFLFIRAGSGWKPLEKLKVHNNFTIKRRVVIKKPNQSLQPASAERNKIPARPKGQSTQQQKKKMHRINRTHKCA